MDADRHQHDKVGVSTVANTSQSMDISGACHILFVILKFVQDPSCGDYYHDKGR